MIPAGSVAAKLTADFSGTGYPGATPATDITGYAITSPQTPGSSPLSVTWGRQQWQGDVTPSRMTGSLISQQGEFTPGNASSPFYPHVRRRARLHLALTVAGVTVDYFDGYANSWTATPQNGSYWYTPLDASDILNRMGSDSPLRAFVVEDALLHSWTALWMLSEASGSTSAGDITAAQPPLVSATSKYGGDLPSFGADTGIQGGYSGTGVAFTGSGASGGVLLGTVTFTAIAAHFGRVQLWFSTTATAAQTFYTDKGITIGMDATGHVWTSVAGVLITSSGTYNDGLPHDVMGQGNSSTGTLTVDGASFFDVLPGASGSSVSWTLPVVVGASSRDGADHFNGTIWAVSRGSTFLFTDPNAMLMNFSRDTTAARVRRLLTYRRNLGSVIDSDTRGVMGNQDCDGETMQQTLLETAQVEGGVLFADGNGQINLRSRTRTFAPAPYLTMTAPPDVATTFIEDIQNYVNDVTVTRTNGAAMRAFNQAAIDQDGTAEQSLTINCLTDQQALDIANWLLAQGTEDQLASPDLTIDLYALASTALALQVLQLRPLDVVTLTNLPANAPASTMSLVVQGGTLTVSTEQLLLSLYTTPMPPQVMAWDSTATGNAWDGTAGWSY